MQKGKILKSNKDKTKINISFWSMRIGKNGWREKKREGKKKKKRRREGIREEDQRYGKVWNLYGN